MEELHKIEGDLEKETLEKRLRFLALSLGFSIASFMAFIALLPNGQLAKILGM